jgi:glycosyltransferase involved in cell wall biosynthesis
LVNNYNYDRFLRDAIDSALDQTYTNKEVVVVDDGSTDDSRRIIAGYGSTIISRLKPNGGQASAFNAGFAICRGEWICFLDSDDVFAPAKLDVIMEHAGANPAAALIAHTLNYCDGDGRPLEFQPPPFTALRLVDDRARAHRGKLSVTLPATSGLALRRDLAAQILPMPEDITITADNYVKLAALGLAKVLLIPDALATQRLHGRNAYTRPSDSQDMSILEASVNIRIACRLRERFPSLRRLAWKQSGRAVGSLLSSGTHEARQALRDACKECKVLEFTPSWFFWFTGALLRSWVGRPVQVG